MSRTRKGSKAPGYEFWSRRPYSGIGHGPVCKRICHGMERAQAKEAVRSGVKDVWLPGQPYPADDMDAFDEWEAEQIDLLYSRLAE